MAAPIKVVQPADKQVPVEIIASAIVSIAEGVKKLRAGPLNEKALILLITNAAPMHGPRYRKEHVTQKQVRAVLDGMEALKKTFLRP